MNNVLKDNLGNILDPKIPRYEEIKYNLVENSDPIKTGLKFNGKDEYVKRVSLGTLPNNTNKTINTGLDLTKVTFTRPFTGMRKDTTNNAVTNLPDASPSGFIRFFYLNGNLTLYVNYDSSSYTGYVDLYFIHNAS